MIASGGVRTADDIWALRDLGCEAAVTGKALYEKTLKLAAGHPGLTTDAREAHHPVPRRRRRPRREGHAVPGPARRGRPGRARRRATTREGADELVFLDITATVEGRDGDARRDLAHRRAGVHPAHRGRRRPHRGRRERAAARRRRQGLDEQRRRARSRAAPAVRRPVRHAVHGDRDRREAARRRRRLGGLRRRGADRRPAATRSSGRSRPRPSAAPGEVLLTSMDRDGTGEGYDLEPAA